MRQLNHLENEQANKLEMEGWLVLSPAGEVIDLAFSPFAHSYNTGGAYLGISIRRYPGGYGGVLGLEDCVRLRDYLSDHIEAMTQRPQ